MAAVENSLFTDITSVGIRFRPSKWEKGILDCTVNARIKDSFLKQSNSSPDSNKKSTYTINQNNKYTVLIKRSAEL